MLLKNKWVRAAALVGMFLLAMGLITLAALFYTRTGRTEIVRETAQNTAFTVVVYQTGNPSGPDSATPVEIVLLDGDGSNNGAIRSAVRAEVSNGGAGLQDTQCTIEWQAASVVVTLSGATQVDRSYVLGYT